MRTLHILFLAGRDPGHPMAGGGDIQAWAWAKWAVHQGHRVSYVCQSHPSLPRREQRDGIEVLRLATGWRLALAARRHHAEHRADIDLVYEDPIGGGRVPYLAPLWAKVPVVAVWHQVSAELLRALHPAPVAFALSLVERLLARFYRRCHLWVPSAERAAEVVAALGFRRDRVHVIPPTIEASAFDAPAEPRREELIYLGLIRRYKRVDDLLRAFSSLLPQHPEARLVIAGRPQDPDYEQELRALAAGLGLQERVAFRFHLSEQDKRALLRGAMALVLPSTLEGFGIVTLEANAVGTPAVVSSGVPLAAVEDGVNGYRFAVGEVEGLRAALARILGDGPAWERMSLRSRQRAEGFRVEAVGERFRALLQAAIGEARAG